MLLVLALVSVCPIVDNVDQAEATFVPSTTSITIATGQETANVDITPISSDGTFAKSDSNASPNNATASFDVTTNNYTGYTLKLLGSDATGNLTNASYSDTLASITSAIDQSTFESGSSYTNKWGIKPSVVNSASNTDYYYPAPVNTGTPATTTEILMETTSVANPTTAKNYNINVGAKVDYTKAAGTYTNTYTLVAIGNLATYTISYDAGGVTDITSGTMPASPTQGTTDSSYIALDSATPTRTGYDFAGWCLGTLSGTTANPGTTCTGTLITDRKLDINQTTNNINTVYATWTAKKYNITIKPGSNITISLNGSTACSNTTSGCEISNLVYNNPYSLVASPSTGYSLNSWSPGSYGSVDNTTSATTTYTVGAGDSTVTASAKANKYTCTNRYYLQNANGGWDGPTTASTSSVDYNTSCSYGTSASPISRTDYKASTSSTTAPGSNNATAYTSCTITTSGCTNTLYFYRNTFALTVSKGTGIASVSSGGTYRWGQAVSISASVTTNPSYYFNKWTTSDANGKFGSATSASTTYTIPKGPSTVTATGLRNTITILNHQIHSGWNFSKGGTTIEPFWECWDKNNCANTWQINFWGTTGYESDWKAQSGYPDDSNWWAATQSSYNLVNLNKMNLGFWVRGYNDGSQSGNKRIIVHLCTSRPTTATNLSQFGCSRVVNNTYNPADSTSYSISANVSSYNSSYYIRVHTIYTQNNSQINLNSLSFTAN